jgi:hypothetical protein
MKRVLSAVSNKMQNQKGERKLSNIDEDNNHGERMNTGTNLKKKVIVKFNKATT